MVSGDWEASFARPTGLLPLPADPEIKLGNTKLHVSAVGTASTQSVEVTQGVISAQKLMLVIGLGGVLLVAAVRYAIWR